MSDSRKDASITEAIRRVGGLYRTGGVLTREGTKALAEDFEAMTKRAHRRPALRIVNGGRKD